MWFVSICLVEPNETMVSFDVVSLFTSIPLSTARQITDQLLSTNSSWTSTTSLSKDNILDLLNLCLSTEFQFHNSYYRQTSGTPIGSPLSSFLAEVIMQDLERKVFSENNNIKLWNRYVDDVFAITKTERIDELYRTIDTTTEDITFPMETEHSYQIAFLEVLLTRTDNRKIKTQVY